MPRRSLCLLVIALSLVAAGCGGEDRETLRERAQRFERQVKAEGDRLRARVQEIIGEIKRTIPEARRTSPQVRSRGRTNRSEINDFLTEVLQSVDVYWTQTLKANALREPVVRYDWIPPGRRHLSACGPAGANAAFYCPSDDTIYVSQQFAADLWDGVVQGLPGERAGFGHAAGDFGVAYVVAHEYAHNLQHEFGLFTLGPGNSAEPFELQADCLAGSWGNSVYKQGLLKPGDIEEAINTALAVGDFDVKNSQHHGTPQERREAWLLGFDGGDPSACDRYVPSG